MIPIDAWSRLTAIIKPATHLILASDIFYPELITHPFATPKGWLLIISRT